MVVVAEVVVTGTAVVVEPPPVPEVVPEPEPVVPVPEPEVPVPEPVVPVPGPLVVCCPGGLVTVPLDPLPGTIIIIGGPGFWPLLLLLLLLSLLQQHFSFVGLQHGLGVVLVSLLTIAREPCRRGGFFLSKRLERSNASGCGTGSLLTTA